jgi:hypothetical protein
MSVARGDKLLQCRNRRRINEPVHPLRAKMTLECCHDITGRGIEVAGGGEIVAVACQ